MGHFHRIPGIIFFIVTALGVISCSDESNPAKPNVALQLQDITARQGENVEFVLVNSGEQLQDAVCIWNYGDGSAQDTIPGYRAYHSYTTPGEFTVTVRLFENKNGAETGSVTAKVTVNAANKPLDIVPDT